MSFLRRLALKSVMAAKRESVAKCAGPLQYGVGRPDGANTMIKTIQYLAEADNSRVLVPLDLKVAFQNVSRSAMLYSTAQTDADLAAVFSKWYTGTTEHRMHHDSACTAGWIRVVLCQTCGFSAAVDPVLRSILAELCTHYDSGAKLCACLDDWYLWVKPQCLLQTIAVIDNDHFWPVNFWPSRLLARRLLAQTTFGPCHFWPVDFWPVDFWPAQGLTTFGPDH